MEIKADVVTYKDIPYPVQDYSLFNEIPKETKIIRTNFMHPLRFLKNKLPKFKTKNFLSHFVWPDYAVWGIRYILKKIVFLKDNYKCIFISMPPFALGLVAFFIKKRLNIPVVLEMRDPWVKNPVLEQNIIKKLLNYISEKKVIRTVDAVITVTHAHKKFLTARYPEHAYKIFYISQGFDPEDFDPKIKIRRKPIIQSNHKTIKIVYTGRLGEPQHSIDYMKKALEILNTEKKRKAKLWIAGIVEEETQEKIKNFPYIIYLGFLERKDVNNLITEADVLWCDYKESYSPFIIPSKLYDYLGAHKPILLTTEQKNYEGAKILQKTQRGVWAKRSEPEEIANKIIFLKENFKLSKKSIEYYSRRELTKKLANVLKWVLKE